VKEARVETVSVNEVHQYQALIDLYDNHARDPTGLVFTEERNGVKIMHKFLNFLESAQHLSYRDKYKYWMDLRKLMEGADHVIRTEELMRAHNIALQHYKRMARRHP
jgi:hypothetical protein